jgi:hypothetical protein
MLEITDDMHPDWVNDSLDNYNKKDKDKKYYQLIAEIATKPIRRYSIPKESRPEPA